MEIKSLEDAEKLVIGTSIMGTGGGGDSAEGLQLLKETIESGRTVRFVQLESLSSDSVVASPYFVGSVAPVRAMKKVKPKVSNPTEVAFAQLESVLGRKITAVTATELGGLNTAVALCIGTQLGLPIVDGDLVGRAAPELNQSTALLSNVSMAPGAIATETGNVVIVRDYGSIDDYEATARHQSVVAGNYAAVVDTPMTANQARKAILPGTISLCHRLGEMVVKARTKGEDPTEAIVRTLNGWRLFEGRVSSYKWRNEGGFLKAELSMSGAGDFKGHRLKSRILNEHIMVWRDEKPAVMPPDLMTLVRKDGRAVANGELRVGMSLTAIAAKAPGVWRTSKGLELFGPKHFGYSYGYVPVEKLLERDIQSGGS